MKNIGYKPLYFHCETYVADTMRVYSCEIRFENQVKHDQTYTYQKNSSSFPKACIQIL
jgi:hypothetical protein